MRLKSQFLCCVLFLLAGSQFCSATLQSLPSSDEVVRKVIERAKWSKEHDFERQYAFVKSTQAEDMDAQGRVVNRSSKAIQVVPSADGRSRVKLEIGSRLLTEDEVEAIADEQLEETRSSKPSSKKRSQKMRVELTEELISRFDFVVIRRAYIGRRPTLVLRFAPKRGELPVNSIQDRFVNHAAGTVWIDEQDYELVKAEIRLNEPVAITGGLLGAVEGFRYFLERTRVDDGVWLLKQTDLFIRGRKFLTPVHTRKLERWSNFVKVADEPQS